MKFKFSYIKVSALACIIACIGEFASIFILGNYYPGYNQLKDTMSSLGASVSPVSDLISAWWIIMGFLMLIFGTGFYMSFKPNGKYAQIGALLIILYGFGEGIGSGAFKADSIGDELTNYAVVHDILGGVGVVAILVFPLFVKKLVSVYRIPYFRQFSNIIFITGIFLILLFMFRFSNDGNSFLTVYKGLWQRLFMLNTYIYLTTIAILMLKPKQVN
jgi:hypothetical protein